MIQQGGGLQYLDEDQQEPVVHLTPGPRRTDHLDQEEKDLEERNGGGLQA